jgi:hypothetical protein
MMKCVDTQYFSPVRHHHREKESSFTSSIQRQLLANELIVDAEETGHFLFSITLDTISTFFPQLFAVRVRCGRVRVKVGAWGESRQIVAPRLSPSPLR